MDWVIFTIAMVFWWLGWLSAMLFLGNTARTSLRYVATWMEKVNKQMVPEIQAQTTCLISMDEAMRVVFKHLGVDFPEGQVIPFKGKDKDKE